MRLKYVLMLVVSVFYCSLSFANDAPLLQSAAQKQGFFFFYSASCPHCQRFAPMLKEFSDRFGFKVIAISVDGGYLPSFPDAVLDEGQKNRFQVTTLPTLFLVNPKSQKAVLVTEGALDMQELSRRVLKVVHLHAKEPGL